VIAGGSQEADALDAAAEAAARPQPEVVLVAWLAAAATVVLGIVPQPLFNLAAHAGQALTGIF
jgi:NADH:ubiquinone oxidoreductase subunit 2 (subunit N)